MFDKEDWLGWINKIKWQLISFKFQAFWAFILLIVGAWYSMGKLHQASITAAKELFAKGYIDKGAVATIITHSQTVLYDAALGHILVFAGALLATVIGLKGYSYYAEHKTTTAAINKMSENSEDLKQFLPK